MRPLPVLPVRRVLVVGVDLRGARKHETGLLGERDGVVLPDIAVLGLRILRRVPLAAMVLETQRPARLQRSIEVREGIWSETFMQPIVKLAKGDDQIGRAGRSNFALANAKNSRRKLAVCRGIGLDLAAKE